MPSLHLTLKSYIRKGLSLSGLSLILSLLFSSAACNDLAVFSGNPLNSSSFEGLDDVQLTSEGQLELTWAKAQDEAQHAYDVYLLKSPSLPDSISRLSLSKGGALEPFRIDQASEDENLDFELIASLTNTSNFTYTQALELGSYYIFKVVEKKAVKSKLRLLAIQAKIDPPASFQLLPSATGMNLTWTPSPGASSYAIQGLKGGDAKVNSSSFVIGGYEPARDYKLCIFAEHGILRSKTCMPVLIPANRSSLIVKSLSSSLAPGVYPQATGIPIEVKFSGKVHVTQGGNLSLLVKHGGGNGFAPYASGSGTSTLIFNYTTAVGDDTAALEVSSIISKDSAAEILDEKDRPLSYSLPLPGSGSSLLEQKKLAIDTMLPTSPSAVTFPSAVSSSEALSFSWAASSDLNFSGYLTKLCSDAQCSSACGSAKRTTVLSTEEIGVDGNSYYACVQAVDSAQNKSAWISSSSPVTVSTSAPSIVSVSSSALDGAYKAGTIIPIVLTYSGTVYVTNANDLSLSLSTTPTSRNAVYSSGSGSSTLVFNYTVQAGDTAADLNYSAPSSLSLGATGAIKTIANVAVSTALPPIASPLSLAGLKSLVIDATAPSSPSAVGFSGAMSTSLSAPVSWSNSADTNFRYHKLKLCAASDCVSSCTGGTTSVSSPANLLGVHGSSAYACVQGEDLAGNLTPWISSISPITIDTAAPSVTSISSANADAYYQAGALLTIDVYFSENVFVTNAGDLGLLMETGATDRTAVYSSGSGTSKLSFSYTVQAGDSNDDLNVASTSALSLGAAGTIRDAAGNNLSLTLPPLSGPNMLSAQKNIVIDTLAPVAPSGVQFLSAKSSSLNFLANWSNSSDANFKRHNVKLCAAADCVTSCSGAISQAQSPATLTGVNGSVYYACVQGEDLAANLSAWVPSASTLTVDTSPPVVSDVTSTTPDGIYKLGALLTLSVQFSKPVFVLGSENLGLLLETGTTDRTALYQSGSGTNTLSFAYTVQAGDINADLEAQSTAALSVGAGSIRDDSGNNAVLTLPNLSGANSISTHKALVIDTAFPSAPASVGFAGASSTSLSFNMSWANSTDLHFSTHNTKLCVANDCLSSCISTSTSTASPKSMTGGNGGVYYGCVQGVDTAGNTSAWIASTLPITVDNSVPTVTNVSSTASDGYFKQGAVLPITVTFSENVYVANGTDLRLKLETGIPDTDALYSSGSGTNTLIFNYTVAASDTSADLDLFSTTALSLGATGTIQDAGTNNANLTLPAPGVNSLAGQKALVIDTTLPTAPSAVTLPNSYSLSSSFPVSFINGTDLNFRYSDAKLCTDAGCSIGCISVKTSVSSPVSLSGALATPYYACIQSRDLAANVSGYIASASTITVENPLVFAGAASADVLGSWADGTGKLELTFGGTPDARITQYQVFYSPSASYSSFSLASPIATINYGDATYDAVATDNKILVSIPAASLQDGYYYVRYYDPSGKYVDANRAVSSLTYVLKGTPGYVLVPKKFSSLSYDYFIMRYEASLSSAGSNAGGDTVTTTESSLAGCSYKFHVNGTVADVSCGSKVITKAAESLAGIAPQVNIAWPTAYYACRNASGANAKVRLPTSEEWRRASKWIGTSYADMWTNYTSNTGGNCNVNATSAASTGSASLCKSALGVQDMAGNLREWVDNRILQYSISGNSESRFSYGPTIGRSISNGIDNIVQRFHTLDPGASGLALTLGANFKTPTFADQKQYGTNVQTWTDPATANSDAIGFRCLGFRADTMPTISQLALPDEPKFVTGDLATAGLIPENLYVKDSRWEQVAITIDGTTTDAVAEGRVNVTWTPWSKTSCNTSGTCTASDAGLVYKLYRFTEPNHQSIRPATPWALGNSGSNYASDKPIDPLAVDSSGTRLYTSSSSDGTLIATISNCVTATPANCSFADLSTKDGGNLNVGKIYNYILSAEDADGNAIVPSVQRYRSPYFAGPTLSGASAFRLEPRLRRASVFLVDEFYQQNQTRPQIMVHVPMEKSGLDHDFFLQKYEASQYGGTVANNSPNGASDWPTHGTATSWVKNAAQCYDLFLQTGTFDLSSCGNGTSINATTATVQSKQGTAPLASIDQGAAWKACRYTTLADSSGKTYSLQLATDAEWMKAADWGDSNQDGTIEASLNPFTGSVSISSLESGGSDATTIRCHTDANPWGNIASNSSGSGSTSSCRSRYGAADMVGNAFEITSGRVLDLQGQDNGVDGLWLGQSFLNTSGGGVTFASLNSGNYDLLRGLPKASLTAPIVFDAADSYNAGSGLVSSIRGDHFNANTAGPAGAGRWSLDLNTPTYFPSGWWIGTRCSF
ncbi:MAG: SUMF1/EgtB/PvdO family nonheme iron enzyme [Oligoflexus sp.]|nr:SUMF1/EgtB/PvdO family nonheme iron enzyme [Oligoflexus sp.]